MIRRRRRPNREIAFSFESFLDVVANVVGIIIRLILVAWIGGRAYKAVVVLPPPAPPPPALAEPEPPPDPSDPRLDQLARQRLDLTRRRDDALKRHQSDKADADAEAGRLAAQAREVAERREELALLHGSLVGDAGKKGEAAQGALLSVEELKARSKGLSAELKKVEARPPLAKHQRYRTPVSFVVDQNEEVAFECKAGRVSLIDVAALRELASRGVEEKLREQWQTAGATPAVGAFRVRYVWQRERTALDGPAAAPPPTGQFEASLSWQVEPVQDVRGESGDQALLDGSAFRKVIDALDGRQTVVTLWVYPDSFALYRRLRDHLHGREVVVAGRPLPDGQPIAMGKNGTASRGQ